MVHGATGSARCDGVLDAQNPKMNGLIHWRCRVERRCTQVHRIRKKPRILFTMPRKYKARGAKSGAAGLLGVAVLFILIWQAAVPLRSTTVFTQIQQQVG